jgi:putative intracellular protease/amidase
MESSTLEVTVVSFNAEIHDQVEEVLTGIVLAKTAMYDLAVDSESQQLIKEFYESGKVVSAVCHGPAAFVNVKLSDGTHLVKGQEVTAFTDVEEEQAGLTKAVPFLLESSLESNGAKIVKADPWQPKVVTSGKNGKLITGQNPASAGPIGEAILAAF